MYFYYDWLPATLNCSTIYFLDRLIIARQRTIVRQIETDILTAQSIYRNYLNNLLGSPTHHNLAKGVTTMDPISTIFAALTAGAVAAAGETAGSAIKDAYEGLKSLIKNKFVDKALAKAAVDAHATEPQPAEAILRPAFNEAAVDQDDELLTAAKALLAMADSEGNVSRRYSLQVTGNVQGVVQGAHANVTMSFGSETKPKE
jgi:hypothetical protein